MPYMFVHGAEEMNLESVYLLVEHHTHDRKVVSLNLAGAGGEFSSPELTFCVQCPFHPSVTALAHKRHWSF